MKAAMLYGVRDLRVEDVEIPEIRAGEVLVKIKAATTCGTDLKIFHRGYVESIIKLPTVFGHEWAGMVTEVGEGVEWPRKGTRVRAGNSAPCFQCTMCERGEYNLCEDMNWLWGAYAEYIRVPDRTVLVNMQEIPQHVSYEDAAIAEPLACVLHGSERAGMKAGDSIAIIGAGPIGLLHLLNAKRNGAEKLIAIDLVDSRLNLADKLGADVTVNAGTEDVRKQVREATHGYGADIVVEAIGLRTTWEQAFGLVRKGGTVLEFGGCPPDTKIVVDAELLHYGEVSVIGAFHAFPMHFRNALELISSGEIDVKPLITKKAHLEDILDAFQTLLTVKSEIKMAIIP